MLDHIGGRRRRFAWGALVLGLVVMVSAPAMAQTPWAARQGNASHTSRVPGVGDITVPAASWRVSIGDEVPGARVRVSDVNGDGALDVLSLVDEALVARDAGGALLWDTPPLGVANIVAVEDFNGDGRADVLLVGRHAVIVDGESGQVVWREVPASEALLSFRAGTVIPVNADDDPELEVLFAEGNPRRVALFDFSDGFLNVEPAWTNTEAALPNSVIRPVVGDFDANPATREVALVNHTYCQIIFIDLAQGATLRQTANLSGGRFCYGLYEAVNVDDDPQDEVVFTGALAVSRGGATLTVYDYVDDAVQWQYDYGVNTADVATLAPAGAIADLDNDGRKEAFIAVFNNGAEASAADDGVAHAGWGVVIYDATNGQTLGVLPDRVVVGTVDFDGDGRQTLITRATTPETKALPATSVVELWTLDGQRAPQLRWQLDDAAVVTQALAINPKVSSRDFGQIPAIYPSEQGSPELLIARVISETETSVARVAFVDGEQPITRGQSSLAGSVGVSLVHTGHGLLDARHVVLRSSTGSFGVHGKSLAREQTLPLSGHVSDLLLVPLQSGAGLQTVFREASGALVALETAFADAVTAPETLWTVPVATPGAFVALDVNQDGLFEVAHSGQDDAGTFFLELLAPDGSSIWRRTFTDVTGAPYALTPGRFSGLGGDLAAMAKLTDGTVAVWTFDGRSGQTLSSHTPDEAEVNRYPNRELVLVPGVDGQGETDDLIAIHYTTWEYLEGATLTRQGDAVAFPPRNSRASFSALELSDPSAPRLFTKNFSQQNVVYDVTTRTATWTEQQPLSLYAYEAAPAGFADANGDGVWDIALPGLLGDLSVMDAVTGEVIYRLCLEGGEARPLAEAATPETCAPIAPLSAVVVADIDGDNGEEFLVGGPDGWLYAIDVEDGALSWRISTGARVRWPAVADVDGDGFLEIAATTVRSELLLFDNAEINPPSVVREVAVDESNTIVAPESDVDAWERTDALGVSWPPSVGADRYVVRLTTLNNTDVTDPVEVVDGTSHVFTDLELLPGVSYEVEVTAVSDELGAAPAVRSDGVAIIGGPPTITDLAVTPETFDLGAAETTTISAQIKGAGITLIPELVVRVVDLGDGVVIYEERQAPGVSTFDLAFRWDGLNRFDEPVVPGIYGVEVFVTDSRGVTASEASTVTVSSTPPSISALSMSPATFDLGLVPEMNFRATATTPGAMQIARVTFSVHPAGNPQAPIFVSLVTPQSGLYTLNRDWDGRGSNATLVATGDYEATIRVTNDYGVASILSAPFAVTSSVPDVTNPVVTPSVFDLGRHAEVRLQASATAPGQMPLAEAALKVLDAEQAVVFETTITSPATTLAFDTAWDGRDLNDALAEVGDYSAVLEVRDGRGRLSQHITPFSIVATPPTITNIIATPTPFALGVDRSIGFQSSITTEGDASLSAVTFTLRAPGDEQIVFQTTEALDAPTATVRTTWDGTFDGAPVSPGIYALTVEATNAAGQSASREVSVNVISPPPQIQRFVALPSPFDLSSGERARFVATLTSGGESPLAEVRFEIHHAEQERLVYAATHSPETAVFLFGESWDGTDLEGRYVAPGFYEASVILTNAVGVQLRDAVMFEVIATPPTIEDLGASVLQLDLGKGEATTFTASFSNNGGVPLRDLRFSILDDEDAVRVDRTISLAGRAALDFSWLWDGVEDNGATVGSGDYRAVMTLTNAVGATVMSSLSFEVLVTGADIDAFQATPAIFDPTGEESTVFTAEVVSARLVTRAQVEVFDLANARVHEETREFDGASPAPQTLSFPWDGVDSDGVTVAEGFYTARLRVTTELGVESLSEAAVEVVFAPEEEEEPETETPGEGDGPDTQDPDVGVDGDVTPEEPSLDDEPEAVAPGGGGGRDGLLGCAAAPGQPGDSGAPWVLALLMGWVVWRRRR